MSIEKKLLAAAAGGVLLVAGFFAAVYYSWVSHVMTKPSHGGGHVAKLYRVDGIDVIFRLYVDGLRVYSSADFAPRDLDFREHIAWSTDGRVAVLEVADERLFGWDAECRRELAADELRKVKFARFEELGFEGEVPDVASENGRAPLIESSR